MTHPTIKREVVFKAEEGNVKLKKGTLSDSNKTWYRKVNDGGLTARNELMTQEFLRLIIPHQPETRIRYEQNDFPLYSEARTLKNLPRNEAVNFTNGTYTGLGQAMLVAMFVMENDLNMSNIQIDEHNRVIKIDGDWGFAPIRDESDPQKQKEMIERDFPITEKAIASLPYPQDFFPRFWIDFIVRNRREKESQIVSSSVTNSAQFRLEVNEAITKICLLPDEFIASFIHNNFSEHYGQPGYMPEWYAPPFNEENMFHLIKNRRDELTLAASKNPDFQRYLLTHPNVTENHAEILKQMKMFREDLNEAQDLKDSKDVAERMSLMKVMVSVEKAQEAKDEPVEGLGPETPKAEEIKEEYPADASLNESKKKPLFEQLREKMQRTKAPKKELDNQLNQSNSKSSFFRRFMKKKTDQAVNVKPIEENPIGVKSVLGNQEEESRLRNPFDEPAAPDDAFLQDDSYAQQAAEQEVYKEKMQHGRSQMQQDEKEEPDATQSQDPNSAPPLGNT